MAAETYHYLFGPVSSRRLGRSLGVDIVPMKTCTQNCLYCQLGRDAELTLERKVYVPTEAVLDELRRRIDEGLQADYITFSGSGEPTLHSELGAMLDGVKALTDIPTAVITNGTLLFRPDVRRDCAKADVVMPSLDAGDEATFQRLNKPHPDLDFQTFVEGLRQFRDEYAGHIWLEVFFCAGINTDDDNIRNIGRLVETIRPDKIQLNTAVRPTTDAGAVLVPPEHLLEIARKIHPKAEIIADFGRHTAVPSRQIRESEIIDIIGRHPCSLEDICKGLSADPDQIRPLIESLLRAGNITAETRNGTDYFKTT